MQNKYRNQSYNFTVPNGTAAGAIVPFELVLDSAYSKCIGYAVHKVLNANGHGVEVYLRDESEVITDYVHYEHLESTNAVPVSDRYHKALFQAANRKIQIKAKPIVLLTADVILQVIFLLER